LTDANFDSLVTPSSAWLLDFYAPWCGHCKNLAPTYERVATNLKASGVQVAKIDCTVETGLSKRFQIHGFPTIKFAKGGEVRDYNGDRSEASFADFVNTGYQSAAATPLPGPPSA